MLTNFLTTKLFKAICACNAICFIPSQRYFLSASAQFALIHFFQFLHLVTKLKSYVRCASTFQNSDLSMVCFQLQLTCNYSQSSLIGAILIRPIGSEQCTPLLSCVHSAANRQQCELSALYWTYRNNTYFGLLSIVVWYSSATAGSIPWINHPIKNQKMGTSNYNQTNKHRINM